MTVPNIKELIETHKKTANDGDPNRAFDALTSALEQLIEREGQRQQFDTSVKDWVDQKTADIRSLRFARGCVLGAGLVATVFTLGAFFVMLFCPSWSLNLILMSDGPKIAYITATFASSFGLLAIAIRGAFRNVEKDEGVSALPESLKLIYNAMKELRS
jgi:hypothetical protein